MYKPSFTVVTCVMVVFAILAFARYAFVGLIPPVNSNALADSRQKFLAYAGHEEIVWHVIESDTFEQARRSNKPILLVIGTSSSKFGREFDVTAFGDVDAAQFVNLNFYCVRIDGYEHPEWINAILPLSRLKVGVVPGFQVWTLDPNGQVLGFIGRTYENSQLDPRNVYKTLVNARKQFDRLRGLGESALAAHDMQAADLQYLTMHPGTSWPSLSAFAEILGTHCDRRFGGFPRGEIQQLYPNAWRFLTLTGNKNLWQESVGPLLVSRLVDIQDGGFFRLGLSRNLSRIEFDKGTRPNAEMMLALALQGQIDQERFDTEIAKRTFDWLLTCASANVVLPACQEDDENPQGRSPRLSFPNWRLRDVLEPADRDWASDHLGLNPLSNAQMVPYFKSRDSLLGDQSTFDRILSLMRSSTTGAPSYNDAGYVDVNGHSAARMLEVARLWGDANRLDRLQPLLSKLDTFDDPTDLIHWAKDENQLLGYLGDYLALSDAYLQEYLASGQTTALDKGLHYLRKARILFKGVRPGQLNLSSDAAHMGGLESLCVPEIADNLGESCTAQAIRLELAYGRLTADSESGDDLIRSADLTTAVFADIALTGGPDTAGYFCAAADVLDARYAIAVGPDARAKADALYRIVPTRFVAPALGAYRRDLQSKPPGIYVIGDSIQGPFTVQQAAKLLPLALVNRASS